MIHITLRRLFWCAVFLASVLAGGNQLAHAAVMMEQLPDLANLPENISGVTSSSVQSGNRIMVTGGQKANSSTFARYSYTFNPTDRSWTSLAPSLQLSYHKQSMLKDGRVLVTGGSKFVPGTGYVYNNVAKIYSPYSNTWSDGASLPVGSIFGNTQGTLLDGRVLIVGGANEIWSGMDRSTMYNQAYVYDPGMNRWEEAAPYPYPIYDAAQSTLKDGRVLVTGGQSHYVYRFDAYLYDPSNNTWTKAGNLPFEGDTFFRHAQVTLPNGKVLVMGKKYFYIYDPATNQWTKDTATIRQLTNAQLSVFGNDVYAMGGYDENWETNVNVYKLTFDFTPPTAPTISGPGPEWSTQDVTAVITPGTDADSGVARTEYSLSGATTLGWTPYNDGDKITITNDGQTTISARTIDLSGNISPIATAVVKIDRTAPTQPVVKLSAASWTASDVTVTITSGTDNGGSGVNRTEFSLSGATTLAWTTYTGLVTITAEGQTTVSARTIDNAGNISSVGTAVVSIDKTAPTAPAVTPATSQWTSAANVAVTITEGTDSGGSGVNRTEYSLTGATTLAWTTYTGPLSITAEGQTTVSARTVDHAGNTSVIASAVVKIDRTAPTAPTLSASAGSWTGSNVTVTITGGTDSGGSGVNRTEYSLTGATTLAWTAYTDPVTITSEGQTTVSTRTIDNVGNISVTASTVVKIDRTAPTGPILSASAGSWTNSDVTVTITGGTDSGGSGVNRTEYSLSGATTLAWTAYTGPVTITAEGQTTVSARTVDNVGNMSSTNTVVVKVDKTAPTVPTVSPATLQWTSAPNVAVTITGGTDSGGSGVNRTEYSLTGATTLAWTTYTGPVAIMVEGQTTVSARTIDHAGNISAIASAVVKIDRAAPTAPALSSSAGPWTNADVTVTITGGTDSGGSGVNRTEYSLTGATTLAWTAYTGPVTITAEGQTTVSARTVDNAGNTSVIAWTVVRIDRTPPAAPIITAPLAGAVLPNNKPTVTGTTEANATVNVTLDGGASSTVTADGSGRWSYTPAAALADGVHKVKAVAKDAAGNESPASVEISFTIDTQPPAPPVIGTPVNGAWINSPRPVITGQAEAGATVALYLDAAPVGTTTADGSGTWTYPWPTDLADGAHSLQATATDAAGNVSQASVVVSFTVDTQAPAAPVILTPADGTVTGNNRPVISGTAEAGAALIIDLDGTETAAGTANAGGSWSYSLPDALTDGRHAVKVRAKDAAGNISPASATVHFTVDTEAPAAPVILAPADGMATKQSKPVIRGTAEAYATVYVVVNGSPAGTVMADVGGSWTFIPPIVFVDGIYMVRATAADAAGNMSPPSTEIRFTVDTLAPPAPIVTSPANGAVTNRSKPAIAGTAEASVTVSVYVDEVPLAETAADAGGRWSYTLVDSLAVGTHAVKAQATDAAGNTGPFSASHTFTVMSDNALLQTLQLSGVKLNETVTGTTYQYTAQVPYSVTATTVAAVPVDGNASVLVLQDGEAVSGPLRLRVGAQTITIQVTAQDGTTVQLYNVLVTRSPSSEVQLSELTLSHAVLAPEFQGGTTRYTATVTNDVYALTVRAKAASSEASIRINGQFFASGEAVLPVELQVGANPITVAVTAQDGVTTQSYTVMVHRKPSSNVLLNGLLLSEGTLSPAFDSGIVHYEAAVEHGVTSMTVTASVYDRNALLTVNGREVASHQPSQPVELQVGVNRLTIIVTAQDRVSTQAYTVEVTRKPSTNAGLTGLRLTGAALSPAFDSEITAYEANVGHSIDSTTVTASVYDPNARISINGKAALSGEASAPIALKVGATTIRITVTAPDGQTVRTYTVRVHRETAPEQPSGSSSGGNAGGGGPAPAEEPKVPQKPAVPDRQPAVPDKPAGSSAACVPVAKMGFTDMSGHWAESSVSEASGCGIVDGFDDGTFRPNDPVTRVQFIAMLVRAKGFGKSGSTALASVVFADQEAIPSWAAEAVSMAAQRGIVNGYEDGSFRPDAQVTRAEMTAMTARASNLQAGPEAELSMFVDAADIPDWAKGYVAAARQHRFVQGRENGRFAPQEHTTRAEAAVLLLRWARSADQ
ncbi:OmpL47-type beta-barrel domain-containing protein [Paenibacillus elgii]|uniref:OmpL47-type beta-barrel domain-containing protein n=1 Tax=Paenibacillus elgii TaxID=189691 RepID=UPI001F320557|nr:Ig-like domain-containing protein [Paenibacillus elgii]